MSQAFIRHWTTWTTWQAESSFSGTVIKYDPICNLGVTAIIYSKKSNKLEIGNIMLKQTRNLISCLRKKNMFTIQCSSYVGITCKTGTLSSICTGNMERFISRWQPSTSTALVYLREICMQIYNQEKHTIARFLHSGQINMKVQSKKKRLLGEIKPASTPVRHKTLKKWGALQRRKRSVSIVLPSPKLSTVNVRTKTRKTQNCVT